MRSGEGNNEGSEGSGEDGGSAKELKGGGGGREKPTVDCALKNKRLKKPRPADNAFRRLRTISGALLSHWQIIVAPKTRQTC